MSKLILVINPGSTSTKIAVYDRTNEVFTDSIEHDLAKLDTYETIGSQYEFRKQTILNALKSRGFDISGLSCVIGRGGVGLQPVKAGGYEVNDLMVDRLLNRPLVNHASNLGGVIAKAIADELGLKAYIYDSVATDEMADIARISGLPKIERTSAFHALNSRAMAMQAAVDMGTTFSEGNFIVAHLGGGISLSVFERGKAVDICADDEGPFSPERSGVMPSNKLVDFCFNSGYAYPEIKKMLRGKGGVRAYLHTIDMKKVQKQNESGDLRTRMILDAMIYQTAKSIGSLATVVCGEVGAIIITGGIAYDPYVGSELNRRVGFIAPVKILPGENEMLALARGAARILSKEEWPQEYRE